MRTSPNCSKPGQPLRSVRSGRRRKFGLSRSPSRPWTLHFLTPFFFWKKIMATENWASAKQPAELSSCSECCGLCDRNKKFAFCWTLKISRIITSRARSVSFFCLCARQRTFRLSSSPSSWVWRQAGCGLYSLQLAVVPCSSKSSFV